MFSLNTDAVNPCAMPDSWKDNNTTHTSKQQREYKNDVGFCNRNYYFMDVNTNRRLGDKIYGGLAEWFIAPDY